MKIGKLFHDGPEVVYHVFVKDELPQLKEISNNLVIFCMATYGEGDPTDNAQEFYEWLQGGSAELDGINFAVSLYAVDLFSWLKEKGTKMD